MCLLFSSLSNKGVIDKRTRKRYLFCRVPFGGESSHFALGGVIQTYLETVTGDTEVKEQLKENTYVDNVMRLVNSEKEAEVFKD